MLHELVINAMHSSFAGILGVSLIFVYFLLLFGTACYRIAKAEYMYE